MGKLKPLTDLTRPYPPRFTLKIYPDLDNMDNRDTQARDLLSQATEINAPQEVITSIIKWIQRM